MSLENNNSPLVDEAIWEAWLQKTKQREIQTAQRMKMAVGALVGLAILAYATFAWVG